MMRFLRSHGLPALAACAMLAAALGLYRSRMFVDNLGVVRAGVLYRSPQPDGRTWEVLQRFGVRRVIDLRTREEAPARLDAERRRCRRQGIRFVHLPVRRALPSPAQVRRFLDELAAADGPTLVHCYHGEDRTGVMVAAYRVAVQAWPIDKALAEMERFRGRPDGAKRRRLLHLLRRLRQTPRSP